MSTKQIEKKVSKMKKKLFRKLIQSMEWIHLTQNFRAQIACLKFLQSDPVYELNWNSSKFHISNSLLKKFQSVQDLIQSINNFGLFQHFEAPVACFSYWIYFLKMILSMKPFGMFHSLEFLQKKLKFLANRCSIWNELKFFKF